MLRMLTMNFITRLNFKDMSVNIDQVLEEKKVRSANPTVLNAAVMSNEIVLNRFAKLIPNSWRVCLCKFSYGTCCTSIRSYGLKLQM
jgi:hypothetical protein